MKTIIFLIIIVLIVIISIRVSSPEYKGKKGETLINHKLKLVDLLGYPGKILQNVYIPKETGGTTEIDLLYITTRGIFVIESKNYAGYIFGSENNRNWTVTLYAGKTWYGGNRVEKHQFYNPIWQNRTHIKNLKRFLNEDIRTFSLIVFDDRGEIQSLNISSSDINLCYRSRVPSTIKAIWERNDDCLSENKINELYNRLLPLTSVSKEDKEKHIQEINKRFDSFLVCPVCGGKLIIRTAKRGYNIGNQFYGCSNYPKCKYTKNID